MILKNEPTADNVEIATLAKHTEGFSGSDLQELCRNASIYRIRDYLYSQYVFKCFIVRKSNIALYLHSSELVQVSKIKESRCICFYNIGLIHSDSLKYENNTDDEYDEEFHDTVRPITMEDLLKSFRKMRTSKLHTGTLSTRQLDLD